MQLGVISIVNFFLSGTTIEISGTRTSDSSLLAGCVPFVVLTGFMFFFGCSGNVLSSLRFFDAPSQPGAWVLFLNELTNSEISLNSSIQAGPSVKMCQPKLITVVVKHKCSSWGMRELLRGAYGQLHR